MLIMLISFSSSIRCEYIPVRNDSPYRAIFCHVRKRDRERFQAALEELPKKMMLLGYIDYLDVCHALWGECQQRRKRGEFP